MPGIIALCFSYVFSQFFRSFLAVLTPVLSTELSMTATQFAYASSAWFITFALFQFPVGVLLDTIGPRRTVTAIFTVFCCAGGILFALANSPTEIIIAMGLIGIGCSPALMGPFYIFVREYQPAKFATLSATFIGIGSLGNIASSEPLAAAIELYGWREAAFVLTAGVVAVGLAIFMLVKDPEKLEAMDEKGGFLDLLKIKQLWFIFPIILAGYMVAAGLRGSWIGPFHIDLYGFDTLEVGRITLYMSIALVLGTLFYGPLDRVFNSRKLVVMAGNLIVLVLCLWMALALPAEPFWSSVAIVLMGFFGASYAVQMAHGKSFIPPHLTGRGVTLLNFCSIGGAGIFQWLSGPVVETFSAQTPQSDYVTLFWYYSIFTLIAIAIYSFSRDAKPSQPDVLEPGN